MTSQAALLPLGYLACGLLPLLLVPYLRAHWDKPGSTGLFVTVVGLALWGVGLASALVTGTYATRLAAANVVALGGGFAATGYLLLALEYTGTVELTRRVLGGFAAALLGMQLLAATDPAHRLVWGGATHPLVGETPPGPLYFVLAALLIGLAIGALLLLVVDVLAARGVRRKQSLALVAAGIPPIGLSIVDVYLLFDVTFSVSPFGFVVSVFAYAWALYRADFLDVVPVARKRIVEEMDDAAVTLDADDRVVECNSAARRLFDVDADYAGMPAEEFFTPKPEEFDRFPDAYDVDTEICLRRGGEPRHFHLQVSRIDGVGSSTGEAGRLIVLRDITELKNREAELEFLRQVLVRVLRHNIRNDLNVVRGQAEHLTAELDGEFADQLEIIIEKSDNLIDLSRKARTIERVIDRDPTTRPVDLTVLLEELVEEVRSTHPSASVSLDAPDRCLVEIDPWFELAFGALLENAVEHNDGHEPSVAVTLERTGADVAVVIADDGPGIPSDELAVLEQGEETPLAHVSGLGLWIVHWIVDRSAGSIEFATGGGGSRVTVRLPT